MMGVVMVWKGTSADLVGSSEEGLLDEEPMTRGIEDVDCLASKFRGRLDVRMSDRVGNFLVADAHFRAHGSPTIAARSSNIKYFKNKYL